VPSGASGTIFVGDPYGYECKGVVFWTDTDGGEHCALKSTNELVVYEPGDTVPAAEGVHAGSYVFSYASPPPPPFLPIGGACVEYFGTEYADLDPVGQVALAIPPTDRITHALSFERKCSCTQTLTHALYLLHTHTQPSERAPVCP